MKKILISLGNENPADNKIILDGKELDLKGLGYFALECDGRKQRWIYGNIKPTKLELLSKPFEEDADDPATPQP